jgi:hypothetical protein
MRVFIVIILLVIGNSTCAQNDFYKLNLGIQSAVGFAWAHHEKLNAIKDTYFSNLTFERTKYHYGNVAEQFCKKGYYNGFQFSYFHFNNSIIGHLFSASYFLEPILIKTENIKLSLRATLGLAYSTNPFDSISNPLNKNYSLYVNPYLNLGLNLRYKVNLGLAIKAALNYNHISNGNIQDPNYGLNFPSVSVGMEKTLNTLTKIPKLVDNKPNWRIDLVGFASNKSSTLSLKDRFWVYGMGMNLSRKVNLLHAYTVGAELMADESVGFLYQMESRKGRSYYRLGANVGHEFLLGNKFVFSQQIGVYIFNQTPYISWIYHRWGLNYKLTENLMIGSNLLADLQKANFLDLRMTYSIIKK